VPFLLEIDHCLDAVVFWSLSLLRRRLCLLLLLSSSLTLHAVVLEGAGDDASFITPSEEATGLWGISAVSSDDDDENPVKLGRTPCGPGGVLPVVVVVVEIAAFRGRVIPILSLVF
jgi:hypothetical protein